MSLADTRLTNRRGALFMVAAMAAFTGEDVLFKSATQQVSVGLALMIFGIFGTLIFATLATYRGDGILPQGGLTRRLMLRSAIELVGRMFYGLALAFADLGSTSTILQATPLVVVAGAVLVFGERVGWRRWLAIILGLIGVLLVLRPTGQGLEPSAIFAVLGMLGFAGRDLATRAAPPAVTNAQLGVLGFCVLFVAGIVVHLAMGVPLATPAAGAVLYLIFAAMFGVTAYSALTAAMRTGAVSAVTPFRYTRLLFALVMGFAVFGEVPNASMLAGAALIVASGLFTLSRTPRPA